MKISTSYFYLLVVVAALVVASSNLFVAGQIIPYSPDQPNQPVIGILSQPNRHSWNNLCGEYVQDTYVHWLASVGVRAVPIHYDTPKAELDQLLDNLNGALFTGGGLDLKLETTFYNTAKNIYDYTVASAQKDPNNKFVLWGTCQGFQLISIIASGSDFSVLECDFTGTDNSMLPLWFTENANSSRFFANLYNNQFGTPTMYDYFTKYNSTGNAHRCGVQPKIWNANSNLKNNLTIITINNDTFKRTFVSMYEHNTAAVYGSQWHPEGQVFWYLDNWNKRPSTIETSHYAGFFLAAELRKNNHSFPTVNVDSNTDNAVRADGSASSSSWLSTLLTQYPIVENPEIDYSGFFCVGGYPGSQKEQNLQSQLEDAQHERDTFAVLFFLTCVVVVFAVIFALYRIKQLKTQLVLSGGTIGIQHGGYANP